MTWARLWKPKFLIFYSIFSGKVSSLERCLFSYLLSVWSLLWFTVSFVSSPIYRQFCLFSDLPSVLSVFLFTVSFVCSLIYRQFCLFSYLPSVLSVLLYAVSLLVLSFTVSFVTVSFVTVSFVCSLINRQFGLFSYLLSVWSLLWFTVSFVSFWCSSVLSLYLLSPTYQKIQCFGSGFTVLNYFVAIFTFWFFLVT